MLNRNGKVYILHWEVEGKIFGPEWDSIAAFDDKDSNSARCKTIVQLMNECDRRTNHPDNDNQRNN